MTFSVKYRKTQGANLFKLFNDKKLCDVTFIVGNEKQEIPAHRLIFASLSNECKNMLNVPQQKIQIDGDPAAFKCVLKYGYCTDPKLDEGNIAAVQYICNKYKISSLSAFCDEWLISLSKHKIKNVRKKIISAFKKDTNAKTQWDKKDANGKTQWDNYGNYKKSKIGRFAVHHILDSDGIRREMADIIPRNCLLKFTFDKVNMKQYKSIGVFKLSSHFASLSNVNVIDDRLYNCKICIEINSKKHLFWCKSFKKSALDRAMGSEVSDYIMRYRKRILIHFDNDEFLIELSGDNVGCGFCNLFAGTRNINGHQMIQIEEGCMDSVEIKCFVKKNTKNFEIEMTLISEEKLKDKNSLVLFYQCMEEKSDNQYKGMHGRTNNCIDSRYAPYNSNHNNHNNTNGQMDTYPNLNDNMSVGIWQHGIPADLGCTSTIYF
eukprot:75354_1